MKRNGCIELMKFFMAICIALGNFSQEILPSGTVVMMFFILSGYFLVGSFDSGKYTDTWGYTLGRVKRMYPYYFAAFAVILLYVGIQDGLNLAGLAASFMLSAPEALLVQNVGVFAGGINYPLWQLSTLIVAAHVLFALMQWNRNLTVNAICPVVGLAVLTYLNGGGGRFVPDIWGVEYKIFYVPLLRAAGGLSVGMFLYDPIKRLLGHMEKGRGAFVPVLVSLASLGFIVMFWFNRRSYDAIIPFAGLLICALYSKGILGWLSRIPLGRLDKLSLGLYLNHAVLSHIFLDHKQIFAGIPSVWVDVIYMVVLIVYSLILIFVVDLLMKLAKKLTGSGKEPAKA